MEGSGPAVLAARIPALAPATGVLAGAGAAFQLAWAPVPLAAALLAGGIALRRTAGALIAGLGAGLLSAAGLGLPADPWAALDPDRPVEVRGRVATHWRETGWGWRAILRVERLAQGRWVSIAARDLAMELPGEVPPAPMGSRLVARGYVGRSPGFANRLPVPPGPWRLRVKTPRLVTKVAAPGPIDQLASILRRRVEAECNRAVGRGGEAGRLDGNEAVLPAATPARLGASRSRRPAVGERGVALVRALVLGDPWQLPPAWLRGLRRTGLAHLLAVSGLHVGLVGALALVAAAPLGRRGRIAVALAAIGVYLLVAGPRPALLRASLMGLAGGAALLAGRAPSAANALALAAAVLVLFRPELMADLGFGLTVAATAGIVLLAPALARRWLGDGGSGGGAPTRGPIEVIRRWALRALAATVGAQLAAAPLALPSFHLLSPAAPLLNLAAVPWTALALAGCAAWVPLAAAVPRAGAAVLPLLDALAAPFGWPALGPPVAWGVLPVAAPVGVCLTVSAALAAVLVGRGARIGLLVLLLLLEPVQLPDRWGRNGPLEVAMLDVGQGDALLLRDGRRAVLVDGGGWRRGDFGGRVLLPALLGSGVRRLEALVLTHPDVDHCGGLDDIGSYFAIGEVWMAAAAAGSPCADSLAAIPGVVVRRLAAGDRAEVGRWRFAVLGPKPGDGPVREAAGRNDRSLVLFAEAGGRRCLLTGDAESRTERRVAARLGSAIAETDPNRRPCDVLKVAHHGSKTSTTPALLAAARPRLALISAGVRNPYGHPAPEVVARLERAGARVLRTDRSGAVHVSWQPGGPLRIELPASPR